jgi:hypothetical protein
MDSVESVEKEAERRVRVHLGSVGVTELSPSIPNFDAALRLLELRSRDQQLIPVVVDKGCIIEIMNAFEDTPTVMKEDVNLGAHRVFFANHAGVYYLKHAHPKYAAIKGALEEAMVHRKLLKIVHRLGHGIIATYQQGADTRGPI